jgi:hypothetical protein
MNCLLKTTFLTGSRLVDVNNQKRLASHSPTFIFSYSHIIIAIIAFVQEIKRANAGKSLAELKWKMHKKNTEKGLSPPKYY